METAAEQSSGSQTGTEQSGRDQTGTLQKEGQNLTEETRTGIIIKGIGGFYTVMTADGENFVCKARGLFRKLGKTPIVGDRVGFSLKNGTGYLLEIYERKNELIRPSAANIDKLLIVVSAGKPEADLLLADKLLICCEQMNIEPVIIINKCDDDPENHAEQIASEYRPAGYKIYKVSAALGTGMDDIRKELTGCVSCLAGQSAVGKSSIINAVLPGMELKVGSVSRKTEKGRHTTRQVELIPLPQGGALLDTPGFSLLDNITAEPEEIKNYYPELRRHKGECRFTTCTHTAEPGCSVKTELVGREFNENRYLRYVRLVKEAEEKRRHKYD